MKFRSLVGCGLVLLLAVALQSDAAAQTCQSGCSSEAKACIQSARTAKLACKLDCRTNAAPGEVGSCLRDCVGTFRSVKDTCRSDLRGCIAACTPIEPPDGSGGCANVCGQDLSACGQDVIATARSCVRDCRSTPDHLACLAACATAAEDGAGICSSNFTSCLADCSGSASGAFVD